MRDAFLSYSRQNSDAAAQVYKCLTDAGYQLWFDRDENMYGDPLIGELHDGVELSRYFVALVSKPWICSDFCRAEFEARRAFTTRNDLDAHAFLVLLDDSAFETYEKFVYVAGRDLDTACTEILAAIERDGPHYVAQCCENLIGGTLVEESSEAIVRALLRYPDPTIIERLWDVATTTRWPAISIDLAAGAIHAGLREISDPRLHDQVLDVLARSINSSNPTIIDKFAYTAGQLQIHAIRRGDMTTAQNYGAWIETCAGSSTPKVAANYTYTKDRVAQWMQMFDADPTMRRLQERRAL